MRDVHGKLQKMLQHVPMFFFKMCLNMSFKRCFCVGHSPFSVGQNPASGRKSGLNNKTDFNLKIQMKTIIHRLFVTNYLTDRSDSTSYTTTADLTGQALYNGKLAKAIKGSTLMIGAVIAILSVLLSSCTTPKTEATEITMSKEALIARGQYIVSTSACHDCHSPKIMTPHGPIIDTTRILSGHPASDPVPLVVRTDDWTLFGNDFTSAVGPWGMSFSANLTPHDTGTGSWSFEQFKTAIRKGKYKGLEGSRSLLPPMPWEVYRIFTDDDLLAIFTYLQSIKPVDNLVPPPIAPEDVKYATN